MKPINFKESNKELQKPSNMTDEECSSLNIYNGDGRCISKWKMSWKERFHCLFKGFVWLDVYSGKTQPPVGVTAKNTMFNTE